VNLVRAATPNLNATLKMGTLQPPTSPVMRRPYHDRRETCLAKKEVDHVTKVIRCLNTMRGDIPEELPFRFEDMQRHTIAMSSTVNSGIGDSAGGSRPVSALGSTAPLPIVPVLPTGGKRLSRLEHAADGKGGDKGKRKSKLETPVVDRRAQARRLRWVRLQACVAFLRSLQRARRRHVAMDTIKTMLQDMSEWVRIKLIVKRFRATLTLLQGACRGFFGRKRQRCVVMEKEWRRLEDHHLSSFFFAYAKRMLAEQKEEKLKKGRRNKSKIHNAQQMQAKQEAIEKQLAEGLNGGTLQVDWRAYRIPDSERRRTVSQYYMISLRNRVRMQSSISDVVNSVVQKQRDMDSFLSEFGTEGKSMSSKEVLLRTVPSEVTPPPFYHLSEDLILHMIALNARRMAFKKVDPYSQHPGLREDVPDNAMYRPPPEGLESSTAFFGSVSGKDETVVACRLDRAIGRLTRKTKGLGEAIPVPPSEEEEAQAAQAAQAAAEGAVVEERKPSKQRMEDVLSSFTPRLRGITDQQSTEYRMNPPPPNAEDAPPPSR